MEHLALAEQKKAEKARDQESAAQTTAEQRQLALNTVRDVLFRVDELMKKDERLVPIRLDIIRQMVTNVDQIRDHALKNPFEDNTEALAYTRIGQVYFTGNRIKDAVEWLIKAHAIFKRMAEEAPTDKRMMRVPGGGVPKSGRCRVAPGPRIEIVHSRRMPAVANVPCGTDRQERLRNGGGRRLRSRSPRRMRASLTTTCAWVGQPTPCATIWHPKSTSRRCRRRCPSFSRCGGSGARTGSASAMPCRVSSHGRGPEKLSRRAQQPRRAIAGDAAGTERLALEDGRRSVAHVPGRLLPDRRNDATTASLYSRSMP